MTAKGPQTKATKRRVGSRTMKTIKISVSAFALLSVVACKTAETPPPAPVVKAAPVEKKVEVKPADKIGAANALFAKGDYAKALEAYDSVLVLDAGNEAAMFNRAVCLHRLGEMDKAKKAYEAVLAKNADDVDATLNLGAIYKDQGNYDEAIAVYNKVLKKDEYNSRVLNNLAALYRLKKQYSKAVDTVRKLLMRDQRNVDAYKNLALVYYDQKKFKLAQTILGNAQKLADQAGKKDPDIFVNLGMIQIALGDNGKAMAAFKQAVELDKNHVIANYNIGSLALEHRDYNLAERSYGVVAKAWPENYGVNVALGYALQGQQKWDDAAKQLVKARDLKVKEATAQLEDEQIVFQLWQIYQTADQPETALKYADEFLKMKNKTCKMEDVADPICGRYIGVQTMIEMKKAPPPVEEKPKATGKDIFTDAPAEGDVPPAEGAPAEGDPAQAPAEGGAEKTPEKVEPPKN
jgi:tetratricopeptide (TPR) repeat protein